MVPDVPDFVRFKRRDVDPADVEKREKQRLYMQGELDRQIEDQQRRKMLEKQKEKEEIVREEQRIARERAEMLERHKREQPGEAAGLAPIPQRQKLPRPAVAAERQVANMLVQGTQIGVRPVPARTPQMEAECCGSEEAIIADYQKQIFALRAERQLAKEEALIYREQLLKVKERQQPTVAAQIRPLPHIEVSPLPATKKPQPAARPESKETCEESLASSSRRLPAADYPYPEACEELEQSLASNTKLVAAAGELYKTWKPEEIQQHLVAKAAALREKRAREIGNQIVGPTTSASAKRPDANLSSAAADMSESNPDC